MKNNMNITVHCLVKNEEVFVGPAILSIIDVVDKVLVFDTGSIDGTVAVIKDLQGRYPEKIVFEEKGLCDKKRHTDLRQEMVDRTETQWFMILDGDEVWSDAGKDELLGVIKNTGVECIMTPFYLCVGDVYHKYYKKGEIEMLGIKDFFYPRVIKKVRGVHWQGDYNEDFLVSDNGEVFFNKNNSFILSSRFWHLSLLTRSSRDDGDYSSGGTRASKRKLTYFFIGRKIKDDLPDALKNMPKLGFLRSLLNFIVLLFRNITL